MAAADPSFECSLEASSQVEIGNCVAATEERVDHALGIVLEALIWSLFYFYEPQITALPDLESAL